MLSNDNVENKQHHGGQKEICCRAVDHFVRVQITFKKFEINFLRLPKAHAYIHNKMTSAAQCSSEAWQKDPDFVEKGSEKIFYTIQAALTLKEGAIIGRHGSTELTWILVQQQRGEEIDQVRAATAERYSGIFPSYDTTLMKEWLKEYKDATAAATVFAACWYNVLAHQEYKYLRQVCPAAELVPLRSLEPYYCVSTKGWTRALEGRRVSVVSSFANTMEKQLSKRSLIWGENVNTLLPESTSWSFVRSYFPPSIAKGSCEWPEGISSWKDAVKYLEQKVIEQNPEIVLLGCGGLAMPLAGRLKKRGIVCVVMGGAIQLLFGIKGKRWENHSFISLLFNDDWVYPSDEEVPGGAKMIEGGCYW